MTTPVSVVIASSAGCLNDVLDNGQYQNALDVTYNFLDAGGNLISQNSYHARTGASSDTPLTEIIQADVDAWITAQLAVLQQSL